MPPAPRDLRERLMEKVTVLGEDECWLWRGATNGKGYGRIWVTEAGEKLYAHRVMYELHHGPIPAGMEIDHLCRKRSCVNPAHLEAVTRRTNQRRGRSVAGINFRKDACPNGHPYDEANTYIHPATGYRQCATCRREYAEAHREELADYRRRYRTENRERINARRREWRAQRRAAGLPTH